MLCVLLKAVVRPSAFDLALIDVVFFCGEAVDAVECSHLDAAVEIIYLVRPSPSSITYPVAVVSP